MSFLEVCCDSGCFSVFSFGFYFFLFLMLMVSGLRLGFSVFQELLSVLYFGRMKGKTMIPSGKENYCLVGK